MTRGSTLLLAALLLAAPPADAQAPPPPVAPPPVAPPVEPVVLPLPPPSPPEWGFDGPYRLELGVVIGLGYRTDDPPFFDASNDLGFAGGFRLGLEASRRVAFGLTYEHLGLWREDTGLLPTGSFNIGRRFDNLLLSSRLYPVIGELGGIYLELGVGPSWQGVSLTGSAWPASQPDLQTDITCSGSGNLGFAFRGQLGFELAASEAFSTRLAPGVDLYRHGDGVVGNCVTGAGTATVFGAQLGFDYGWAL